MPDPKPQTWIDLYADWATKRSPLTPRHFHENIALALVAGAIAGRAYVQLAHAKIYPNLYTLIVAKTSVFAKTTAFDVAREVIAKTMPEKIIEEIATPEAFVSLLAGTKPSNFAKLTPEEKKEWAASAKWGARRLYMLDEAGRLFNILKRDYASDLADIIMKLYDATGSVSRTTRKTGYEKIKVFALSCLFATTPATIRSILSTADAWASGFWVRWNFVAEEKLTTWDEGIYIAPPQSVIEPLRKMSTVYFEQYNDKPYSAAIDCKVAHAFNESTRALREQIDTSDDEKMDGMLSRLPIKHLKAALVFALLESEGRSTCIRGKHWELALPFAERWKHDALLTLDLVNRSERMQQEEKAWNFFFGSPQGASARELCRYMKITAREAQALIEIFRKNGDLVEVQSNSRSTLWKCKLARDGEATKIKLPIK